MSQFETIYGVSSALTGIITCIQYSLLKMPPTYGDICALIVAVATFIPPSIIFIMSTKTLRKIPPDVEADGKNSIDSGQLDQITPNFDKQPDCFLVEL